MSEAFYLKPRALEYTNSVPFNYLLNDDSRQVKCNRNLRARKKKLEMSYSIDNTILFIEYPK